MLAQSSEPAYPVPAGPGGDKPEKTLNVPEYSGAFVFFSYYDDRLSLKYQVKA